MDKIEMLFVRACKSINPQQRMKSVYKKFYLGSDIEFERNINMILADIIDEYFPMKIEDYIRSLSEKKWLDESYNPKPKTPIDDWEYTLDVLINHIRFIKSDQFLESGCILPRKFRSHDIKEDVVNRILNDLTDRRGFRQVWDEIDDDIRDEIRESIKKIIQ